MLWCVSFQEIFFLDIVIVNFEALKWADNINAYILTKGV